MKKKTCLLHKAAVLVGVTLCATAIAQDYSSYYTVRHPEQFDIDWAAFYQQATARTAAVRERLPHHLDLAYGPDAKQRLDLYLPAENMSDAPVFLFLHGGGFREGDRAQYGFIAEPFAERGIVTAVASYRLTGDGHGYPAQPGDVKDAIQWLHENVGEYGGDPDVLFVGGHSAGAILSADVGVDRAWLEGRGIPKAVLRGIAPVSGRYDLRRPGRAGEGDAYAPTAKLQERASPVLRVKDPAPAAVVALGSVEERYLPSSEKLVEKLEQAGTEAELLVLENEDHKDTALSLADPDSPLFRSIHEMIAESSGSP